MHRNPANNIPTLGRLLITVFTMALLATPGWANQLMVSTSPDRSDPMPLDGQVIDGEVYIFFDNSTPASEILGVDFFLNGKLWFTDGVEPYDFNGEDAGEPRPINPTSLPKLKDPAAPYELEAVMNLTDAPGQSFRASFRVAAAVTTDELLVTSVKTDAPTRRLTLQGFNFDLISPKIEPIVMLDRQPLAIESYSNRILRATLPPIPLVGDHLVNVSLDGKIVHGLTDSLHAELLVTIGATELSCQGCVSASEVNFPYAAGDALGGRARMSRP